MRRQGVLHVSRQLLDSVSVETVLPAQHQVAATRDSDGWPWVDYLIEGPDMPEVAEGAMPSEVTPIFRQEAADGKITAVWASWAHRPGAEWGVMPRSKPLS